MLLIIAHHYVVNSGITDLYDFESITGNMIFLQIYGMFGKAVINCFTMITGYFMIKTGITLTKFLKMYLEVKFYYIGFYLIFLFTGYEAFSIKSLIKTFFCVIYEAGNLYTGTYIVFFLFIPFLNVLARNMSKKQYEALLFFGVCYFVIFSTFFMHETFDFIGWMIVVYLMGAYIRLYPKKVFDSKSIAGIGLTISIALMAASIIFVDFIGVRFGFRGYYYLLSDSHKLLALICSVFAFLLFKNLKIKQSRGINKVAASTFGILLIHTNSDTMRRFLWQDLFNNVLFYNSQWLILQAVGAVAGTYIVCLIMDQLRMRFIERPLFSGIEKSHWVSRGNKKVEELS